MDQRILVDVHLIALINKLPLAGVYPFPFFTGKEQDPGLSNWTKEKYNLTRDKRGFSIASINDIVVRFIAKLLSSKLLRKM